MDGDFCFASSSVFRFIFIFPPLLFVLFLFDSRARARRGDMLPPCRPPSRSPRAPHVHSTFISTRIYSSCEIKNLRIFEILSSLPSITDYVYGFFSLSSRFLLPHSILFVVVLSWSVLAARAVGHSFNSQDGPAIFSQQSDERDGILCYIRNCIFARAMYYMKCSRRTRIDHKLMFCII